VQLSTYDVIKQELTSNYNLSNGLPVHFCASWITGAAVVMCMQPFDFAATRLVSQQVETTAGGGTKGVLYSGTIDVISKTVRAEGVLGVYKGVVANYLRFGPYCILTFIFLEQLRNFHAYMISPSQGIPSTDRYR
jgi:solute carrier family 25 protein 34/35